jgi:hypothetical protein
LLPIVDPLRDSFCEDLGEVDKGIWEDGGAIIVDKEFWFELGEGSVFLVFAAFEYFFQHFDYLLIREGETTNEQFYGVEK